MEFDVYTVYSTGMLSSQNSDESIILWLACTRFEDTFDFELSNSGNSDHAELYASQL